VLRHPLLVARQILTVAQFAPGRLALGLGIGGDDRREVTIPGRIQRQRPRGGRGPARPARHRQRRGHEIVTQWPVTATGKVKKHELRKAIAT
jgi:hypothetical protein